MRSLILFSSVLLMGSGCSLLSFSPDDSSQIESTPSVVPTPTPAPAPAACPGGSQTFSTAGSGSVTAPAGCTGVVLRAWGGGGGGGSVYDGGGYVTQRYSGGAGAYTMKVRSISAGETISFTVGAGAAHDSIGGDTTIDGMTAGGGIVNFGGSASGGDTNVGGHNGTNTGIHMACDVGDGFAGASATNGGGAGGVAGLGASVATINGGDGASPGAGGGGGGFDCPGAHYGVGGAGGGGQIIVQFY